MSYVGDIQIGCSLCIESDICRCFWCPKATALVNYNTVHENVTLANCLYIFKQYPITPLWKAICLLRNVWLEHIAGLFYPPTRFHHTRFLIVWIPQRRYRSQYIFKEDNATFVNTVSPFFCFCFFLLFLETKYAVYFMNSQDSLWWQRLFKLNLKIVCEL